MADSLLGSKFYLDPDGNLPPEMILCLRREESLLQQGKLTFFSGTCRLSTPDLQGGASPVAEHAASEHLCKGHAVLRYRVFPDPVGDELLRNAGAWRVETRTAPWMAPDHSSQPVALILCEHVADVLPPTDRRRVYAQIRSSLAPEGVACFAFFQISALPDASRRLPYEDGYLVQYGKQDVFFRPFTEAMARKELLRELGGIVESGWLHHHELVMRWRPA